MTKCEFLYRVCVDWKAAEEVMWVCLHPIQQQVRGPVWAGPVPGGGALCQRAREGRQGREAEESLQRRVHTLDRALQPPVELIRWMAE